MAYQHARSNACYSNAVLSGLAGHTFDLRIAGTSRKSLVDKEFSFTLRKATGRAASTATFTVNPGATVTGGQDVVMTLGEDLFWGGTVTDVTDVISGQLVRQSVECTDWRWRMDAGLKITRRLVDVAANTAVATIVTEHTDASDGFRVGYVDPSLPRVTVELEDASVMEALTAIADAAGAAVLRIRPTKRVDMYSSGFPSPAALTLVNTTDGMSLSRRTESAQIRTRVRAVGSSAKVIGDVAAGATSITVETSRYFRPTSGTALVSTASGPMTVTYSTIDAATGVMTGVSGVTAPIADGDDVAPVEVANDTTAQTALASILGRSTGVVEHVLRIDGDYLAAAAAAAADLSGYKYAIPSVEWIEQGPLARFYEAGEPVSVTLTSPITQGASTFTVQQVDVYPGDVLASDNPRLLAKVSARLVRRPDLVDMFAVRGR